MLISKIKSCAEMPGNLLINYGEEELFVTVAE